MGVDLSKVTEDNLEEYIDHLSPDDIQKLSAKFSAPRAATKPPVPAGPIPPYNGPKQHGGTGEKEVPLTKRDQALMDAGYSRVINGGTYPDFSMGQSAPELVAAGAGKTLTDIGAGIGNKLGALGAMFQDPKDKAITMAAQNSDKLEKQATDDLLMRNPAAQLGSVLPAVGVAAASPPAAGAQMARQFALSALPSPEQKTTGPLSEFAGSTLKGSTDALLAGFGAKAVQGLGKASNAAVGRFTPEGTDALGYADALQRATAVGGQLGERPPLGYLAPQSVPGQLYRTNTDYAPFVKREADILRDRMAKTEQIPSTTQGVTEPRTVPFGQLQDDLTAAVQEQYSRAGKLYEAVDDTVIKQGLGNIEPQRFYNQIAKVNTQHTIAGPRGTPRNNILQELVDYSPGAFDWLTNLGPQASKRYVNQTIQDGVLPSNYHEMRVAINKALNKATRKAASDNGTMEDKVARDELRQLKVSLDADAEAWAAKNAGNAEAMGQYKHATDYFRENLAPAVIENPLARKLTSKNRPFNNGQQVLSAVTGNAGTEAADLLRPTMLNPRALDTMEVLRGPQPHYADPIVSALKSGVLPGATGANLLEAGVRMAAPGRGGVLMSAPLSTIGTMLSGLPNMRAPWMQKLYFGKSPTGLGGRLGVAGAQGLEEIPQRGLDALTSQRRPGQP